MFEQIGAVLAEAPVERERTPVRRHSRAAGKCESVFWRRTDRQQVRQIVLAARRYELAGRQPGARNGPLGGVAIELLEAAEVKEAPADSDVSTFLGRKLISPGVSVYPVQQELVPWELLKLECGAQT